MTTGRSKWCADAPMLEHMDFNRRRRTASTILALLLAVESVTVVSVAAAATLAPSSAARTLPATTPAGQVLAETGTGVRSWELAASPAATADADARDYLHPKPAVADATPVAKATSKATTPTKRTTPKVAKPTVKPARTAKPSPVSYRGRNRVWIPSLGINQSLAFFSCSRSTPPGNSVYRWGCAGTNNVYLLGHAYSVFKPLHDAYVNGRLVRGMKVYYADGTGRTHVYAVRWWKVTKPTTSASWAWAAQAVPSMTLQTCVGAQSQYRLMVRLVQVG